MLEPEPEGRGFTGGPATPEARTVEGLVVYRFAASLYYANAEWFDEEVLRFVEGGGDPVRWICLDLSALPDIDFTGSEALAQLHRSLHERGIRMVFAEAMADTRAELDRFGITDLVGEDAYYDSVAAAVEAFRSGGAGPTAPVDPATPGPTS